MLRRMTVSVARAEVADSARLRAVRLRALRADPDAFWSTAAEEEDLPDSHWRERLARPEVATFLARLGGTEGKGADGKGADVGIVVLAPHHDRPGDLGLYAMWVAPEARNLGVAAALVTAGLEWARAAGYATVRLEVADRNAAAIALYERFGFRPTGRTGTLPPPREHIAEHERAVDLRAPTCGPGPGS
jgi:ribosomal protein S18 acetylase RimI-like enzyme